MYGTGIVRGGLIREGAGPITVGIMVKASQGDGKRERRRKGQGRRVRVEGGETWGPVVGYV